MVSSRFISAALAVALSAAVLAVASSAPVSTVSASVTAAFLIG